MTFGDKIKSLRKDKKWTVLFSYLLEKKDRTYNSVNLLDESCIQVAVYDDGTGEEVRSKFGKESE